MKKIIFFTLLLSNVFGQFSIPDKIITIIDKNNNYYYNFLPTANKSNKIFANLSEGQFDSLKIKSISVIERKYDKHNFTTALIGASFFSMGLKTIIDFHDDVESSFEMVAGGALITLPGFYYIYSSILGSGFNASYKFSFEDLSDFEKKSLLEAIFSDTSIEQNLSDFSGAIQFSISARSKADDAKKKKAKKIRRTLSIGFLSLAILSGNAWAGPF